MFACLNEAGQAIHLRQRTGRLHIGDLEVVAQVRVGIFVVIAERQGAQLLSKAFAAGVVTARPTVAITAPIAERLDDGAQVFILGKDHAAFTHGDVVRRVETAGGDVAEGTDVLAFVTRAECIAAIFYHPTGCVSWPPPSPHPGQTDCPMCGPP